MVQDVFEKGPDQLYFASYWYILKTIWWNARESAGVTLVSSIFAAQFNVTFHTTLYFCALRVSCLTVYTTRLKNCKYYV